MQDTNGVQFELLTLLVGPVAATTATAAAAEPQAGSQAGVPDWGMRPSLTAVGDPDQSIYSFLHSAPDVFARFQATFGARQLCLRRNYR